MPSDAQDIAVARYLKQEGMVSPEHLQQALQAQANAVESGKPLSLAAALLEIGAITPAQKDTLEKRLKGEEKRGTQNILHYKLQKKLGEGGMGAVYLAEDTRSGKRVALKILPRKHAADPEFMKRFKREAEAAGKLNHPNIVRAFESGEDSGYHFYAMEYCEGEPLDRVLKSAGLLSWHRAFGIVCDAAKGLQYAHAQGFIHRDIKPANLFLTKEGTTKILDLGLTKKIDESQLSFQTLSGAVLGTPDYISPEQAQSDKTVDGRTDIYSLGATLYHLLTGEPPFSGTTLYEILSKHVNAQLPNPQDVAEDIPDGVVHVLRKMMAKSANDRYADCGELVKDVELVLQGKTPESAALGAGASAVAHLRKKVEGARRKRAGTYRMKVATSSGKPQTALVWGGVAAVLVMVLVFALASAGKSTPPPDPSLAVPRGSTPPVPRTPELSIPSKSDPGATAKNRLEGLPRTPNEPPPATFRAGSPVNLLSLAAPAKNWSTGRWEQVGTALATPKEEYARMQIPFAAPENYDLRLVVERKGRPESLNLGIPLHERRAFVVLDGRTGRQSWIEGLQRDPSPGNVFQQDKPTTIVCEVRANRLSIMVDGRPLLSWEGDPSKLGGDVAWKVPDERAFVIGAYDTRFLIHRMELIALVPGR